MAYQSLLSNGIIFLDETTIVEACSAQIRRYGEMLVGRGMAQGSANSVADKFARDIFQRIERNLPPCPLPEKHRPSV